MRTVATETDIIEATRRHIEILSSCIRIECVVLFGSYANPRPGRPDEWSDFDIAIISPDFENLPSWQRQDLLARCGMRPDTRISPIGYPSSEYHNPGRHSFLREIIRTGRVIYQRQDPTPT